MGREVDGVDGRVDYGRVSGTCVVVAAAASTSLVSRFGADLGGGRLGGARMDNAINRNVCGRGCGVSDRL